jgi:hypothetical protein
VPPKSRTSSAAASAPTSFSSSAISVGSKRAASGAKNTCWRPRWPRSRVRAVAPLTGCTHRADSAGVRRCRCRGHR